MELHNNDRRDIAERINDLLEQHHPDCPYWDIAEIVADLLIHEYGQHNFEPFMAYLKGRLKGEIDNNCSEV